MKINKAQKESPDKEKKKPQSKQKPGQTNASPVCYQNDPEIQKEYRISDKE